VQEAFLKHQAFQCGYCTPGMIMAVKGLLLNNPHPTESQARDYLSGNLCRCGTYVEVLAAVKELAGGWRVQRFKNLEWLKSMVVRLNVK